MKVVLFKVTPYEGMTLTNCSVFSELWNVDAQACGGSISVAQPLSIRGFLAVRSK